MRPLIRRGLVAAAATAMAALALVGAAHLPFVRARVFEWARAQAAHRLGIVVDADAVAYNLATASVMLRNLRVSAAGEPPFFRADSILASPGQQRSGAKVTKRGTPSNSA